MGVVHMANETSFRSRGYPYCVATLYVYCDSCRSFRVRTYLSVRKWLLILSSGGLVAALAFELHRTGDVPIGWVLAGLAAVAAAVKLFWGDVDYRCRNCGRVTTARHNTLSIPSDPDRLEVSAALVVKRHLGYWPDLYDLERALQLPAAVARTAPAGARRELVRERLGEGFLAVLVTPLLIIAFSLLPLIMIVGAVVSDVRSRTWAGGKKPNPRRGGIGK